MSIKARRGMYDDFIMDRMEEGELAIVLGGDPNTASGKSIYFTAAPGDCRRLMTKEDLKSEIYNSLGEITDELSARLDAIANEVELAETSRVAAEDTRKSNETARVNAESARATAENSRKSAETARVQAESSRATAETSRASAEVGRITAESKRAESAKAQAKEVTQAVQSIGESKERANEAAAQATAAAGNANAVTKTVEQKLANGELNGPAGPPGSNGITTPVSGFYTLGVENDGYLYAYYADGGAAPDFEIDSAGDLYYTTPDS